GQATLNTSLHRDSSRDRISMIRPHLVSSARHAQTRPVFTRVVVRGRASDSISIVARAECVLSIGHGFKRRAISDDELVSVRYTATRFGGCRHWLTCLKCLRRYLRNIWQL